MNELLLRKYLAQEISLVVISIFIKNDVNIHYMDIIHADYT